MKYENIKIPRSLKENYGEMLRKARANEKVDGFCNISPREELLDAVIASKEWDIYVGGKMTAEDAEWIRPLAEAGVFSAICCLIYGMHFSTRLWIEDFTDEDSGEHVSVERCEWKCESLFAPDNELELRLCNILGERRKELTTFQLKTACRTLEDCDSDFQTIVQLRRELLERGDPDSTEWFECLCHKSDKAHGNRC